MGVAQMVYSKFNGTFLKICGNEMFYVFCNDVIMFQRNWDEGAILFWYDVTTSKQDLVFRNNTIFFFFLLQ